MAVRLHGVAKCLATGCPWEAAGDPEAVDGQAHLHSTTEAQGATKHPTSSRSHPTTRCDREGCSDD
jgi:hypothetical protein